jgi:arylformamidase
VTIRDISIPLHEGMALYEGDPPVRRWCYRTLPGDPYEAAYLACGAHAGTHLDAPSHFFAGGMTADAVPLHWLCGPTRVVDLRATGESIGAEALARLDLQGVERLLLRTVSGAGLQKGRIERFAHLTPSAAAHLVELGTLRLVGIDALSIEVATDPSFPVHRRLLGAAPPVLVLEGLDLETIAPGDYELLCLPLRWLGAEASPVRAVLRDLAPT